jgi:hypothetical protein
MHFPKSGEPCRSRSALVYVLQLLRHPSDLARTPAMEAGISSQVWSVEELVGLVEGRTDVAVA